LHIHPRQLTLITYKIEKKMSSSFERMESRGKLITLMVLLLVMINKSTQLEIAGSIRSARSLTRHSRRELLTADRMPILSRTGTITRRTRLFMSEMSNPAPSAVVSVVPDEPKPKPKQTNPLVKFFKTNWLVLGEILVITIAKNFPDFGATGGPLRPEFFISKLGVFTIFFINGLQLSIQSNPDDVSSATKTNALIQLFNFAFIPLTAKLLAPYYPEAAFRCVRTNIRTTGYCMID
jgi:SBF-like CPA transporter family (DUF4137)